MSTYAKAAASGQNGGGAGRGAGSGGGARTGSAPHAHAPGAQVKGFNVKGSFTDERITFVAYVLLGYRVEVTVSAGWLFACKGLARGLSQQGVRPKQPLGTAPQSRCQVLPT